MGRLVRHYACIRHTIALTFRTIVLCISSWHQSSKSSCSLISSLLGVVKHDMFVVQQPLQPLLYSPEIQLPINYIRVSAIQLPINYIRVSAITSKPTPLKLTHRTVALQPHLGRAQGRRPCRLCWHLSMVACRITEQSCARRQVAVSSHCRETIQSVRCIVNHQMSGNDQQ